MKYREGFVSNSSSSSFLILSEKELKSEEDFMSLFNRYSKESNKTMEEVYGFHVHDHINDVTLKDMMERCVRGLSGNLKETKYDPDSPDFDILSIVLLSDWKELLEDKDSWLFEFFEDAIHEYVEELFFSDDLVNIGGQLKKGMLFDMAEDIIFDPDTVDDMVKSSTGKYLNKIIRNILKRKLIVYYINVSSEGGSGPYSDESRFLRYNWSDVIDADTEYFEFIHG